MSPNRHIQAGPHAASRSPAALLARALVADDVEGRVNSQSSAEEIANAISHGAGVLLACAASPLLILRALEVGDALFVAGVSVFCASVVFIYLASTLYHAMPPGPAKRFFWNLDHAGIFLVIAGTYTPFTLGVLAGGWGWALFGAVWSVAAFGVLMRLFGRVLPQHLSTLLYLLLGWAGIFAMDLLVSRIDTAGLLWLLAGGVAYTLGGLFFMLDRRVRYAHLVWHLFALLGTGCHFVAIGGYAA